MDGADFLNTETRPRLHEFFLEVKNAGRSVGVSYHEGDKSVAFGRLGKTLGGENDTVNKTTRPIAKKSSAVIGQTVWLLGTPQPVLKDVEVLTGSWISNRRSVECGCG